MIIDNFYQGQVIFNPNFFTYLNDVQNSLSSNTLTANIKQGLLPSISGLSVNINPGIAQGLDCFCPWLNNGLGASIPTILQQITPISLVIPPGFIGFIVAQLTSSSVLPAQSQYIFSTSITLVTSVAAVFPNGLIVSQVPLAAVTNIEGVITLNLSQGSPRIAFTLSGGSGQTADNINGGEQNQIPYQLNAGLTGFIPTRSNSVLVTNNAGVPQFSDVLPAVSGANLTNLPFSEIPFATDTTPGVVIVGDYIGIDGAGHIFLPQSVDPEANVTFNNVNATVFNGDVGQKGIVINPTGGISFLLNDVLSNIYSAIPAATPLATTLIAGSVIVPTAGNISVDGSGNISIPQSVATTAAFQVDTLVASGAISAVGNSVFRNSSVGPSVTIENSAGSPGLAGLQISNTQIVAQASGVPFAYVGFSGSNGTGTSANAASIVINAAEAWTPSANGSHILFYTTPVGTLVQQIAMQIRQDKRLIVVGDVSAPTFTGSIGATATAINPIGPTPAVVLNTILSDIYGAIPASTVKASWIPVDSSGGTLPSAVVVNSAIYSVINNNLCMVLFDVTYPTTTGDLTLASLTGLPVSPAFFGWGTGRAGTLMTHVKILGAAITFYSTAATQLTNSDLSDANLQITAYLQI